MAISPTGDVSLTQIIEEFGAQGVTSTTPGSGSVTTPSGTRWVIVQIWGGGGGGGGLDTDTGWGGAGGGAGGYSASWQAWTSGTISYTVGFGGGGGIDGGTGVAQPGNDGGNTTAFGMIAYGGDGGGAGFNSLGGAGGEAFDGDVNTTGGTGSAADEPGVGGLGGSSITSPFFYYDGGLSSGIGGTGSGLGGVSSGEAGQSGMVRIIFLGDFGLDNNLRSYFRQTSTGTVDETPEIIVPDIVDNSGIPTSGNISIRDFSGASAQESIGQSPSSPPVPPPVTGTTINIQTASGLTADPTGSTEFAPEAQTTVELTSDGGIERGFPTVQTQNCGVSVNFAGDGSNTLWFATFTTPASGTSCSITFAPGPASSPPPGPIP